jgi:hypothetical protein
MAPGFIERVLFVAARLIFFESWNICDKLFSQYCQHGLTRIGKATTGSPQADLLGAKSDVNKCAGFAPGMANTLPFDGARNAPLQTAWSDPL